MATVKSSAENLTLNADGSGNDILFQSNGTQVGSLTAEGVFTATSFAGSGAALTGLSSFDPDGAVVFNESGADVDFRVESNNNANMFVVDGGNDRVGIGTTSPSSILEIEKDQNGHTVMLVDNNTAGTNALAGYTMSSDTVNGYLRTFSGTYSTSQRNIQSGTQLFTDGAGGLALASAHATAGVSFWTNDTKRWTIDQNGDLIPANTATGIVLGSTSNTDANTLDDYEEGTFTLSIQDWSDATFSMGTITAAKYTKIGNMVTIWWNGLITSTASNPSDGDVKLSGFPFSTAGGVAIHVPVMTSGTAILTYNPRFQFYGSSGYFYDHNTSGGSTPMANAFLTSTRVNLNFSYMVS